jgi:hypothetical protein
MKPLVSLRSSTDGEKGEVERDIDDSVTSLYSLSANAYSRGNALILTFPAWPAPTVKCLFEEHHLTIAHFGRKRRTITPSMVCACFGDTNDTAFKRAEKVVVVVL